MTFIDRVFKELERQRWLDLRDNKARGDQKEEEILTYRWEMATSQDDNRSEDSGQTENNSESSDNNVCAQQEFVGCGEKKRTWIAAPVASPRVPLAKAKVPKEGPSQHGLELEVDKKVNQVVSKEVSKEVVCLSGQMKFVWRCTTSPLNAKNRGLR